MDSFVIRIRNGLMIFIITVENINSSRQSNIKEILLKIQLSDTPQLHSLVELRLIERNKRKTEQAPKFRVGDTV